MNYRKKKIELILFNKRLKKFLKSTRKNKHRKRICKKNDNKSNLVKYLLDSKFTKKCTIHKKRKSKLIIPKNFSFIENPNETISTLKNLVYLCTNSKVNEIFIDHSNCTNLDIDASTVMDLIIMELKKIRKIKRKNLHISGQYRENIKDMLEASGIIKHLGWHIEKRDYIRNLELIECGNSGKVATDVTDYINECLETKGFELNKKGKGILSQMVGEVLNNCEIHGGKLKKWYTIGHYNCKNDYGEVQLAIFNFGKTIYENLKCSDTSVETKNALLKLSSKHNTLFKSIIWNEEALWTLYSLQDGVSRVRDSKKDPDRGTGTIKLIESFQAIGKRFDGTNPLMSVTSGGVSILFNDKYKLRDKEVDGESRKVIAFNNENSLLKLPDKENVRVLRNSLPGTMISMKFYIDKDYISKLMEEKNENIS